MIDYFYACIEGVSVDKIRQNPHFDFISELNERTGEINQNANRSKHSKTAKVQQARFRDLTVSIVNDRRVTVQGSLHQFAKHGCNYDDFNRFQINSSLDELSTMHEYPLDKFILHNLEFGVNIVLPFPVKDMLKHCVCYKGRKKEYRLYGKKGEMVKFNFKQYELKLYDKGGQYNLDKSLLRVELKLRKMQFLNRLNNKVANLADLKTPLVLSELGKKLIDCLSGLVIIDPGFSTLEMNKNDRKFVDAINKNNYWQNLFKEKQYKYRKDFSKLNKIANELGSASMKWILTNKVEEKWKNLLRSEFQRQRDGEPNSGLRNTCHQNILPEIRTEISSKIREEVFPIKSQSDVEKRICNPCEYRIVIIPKRTDFTL